MDLLSHSCHALPLCYFPTTAKPYLAKMHRIFATAKWLKLRGGSGVSKISTYATRAVFTRLRIDLTSTLIVECLYTWEEAMCVFRFTSRAALFAAMMTANSALADEPAIKLPLTLNPGGPATLDGAISAYCELRDRQGDIYRSIYIVATNNVDRTLRCTFECTAARKGGGQYGSSCSIALQPRQNSGCGIASNLHEYTGIIGGGYSCE